MPKVTVDGTALRYEILGSGDPVILTPGGRMSLDIPGLRPLGERLAERMTVVLWDRPNTGGSDFNFSGETESAMVADHLAGLIKALDLGPTVIAGGSAGSRVSVLCAGRHPEVVKNLVVWMMSGGLFGTTVLAHYVHPLISEAMVAGMEGVANLPEWAENLALNPAGRDQLLALDTDDFISVMLRWMLAYIPRPDEPLPGVSNDLLAAIKAPTLIFANGNEDLYHPYEVSVAVHEQIDGSRLVAPPWGEAEFVEASRRRRAGTGDLFDGWHLLAPGILDFVSEVTTSASLTSR